MARDPGTYQRGPQTGKCVYLSDEYIDTLMDTRDLSEKLKARGHPDPYSSSVMYLRNQLKIYVKREYPSPPQPPVPASNQQSEASRSAQPSPPGGGGDASDSSSGWSRLARVKNGIGRTLVKAGDMLSSNSQGTHQDSSQKTKGRKMKKMNDGEAGTFAELVKDISVTKKDGIQVTVSEVEGSSKLIVYRTLVRSLNHGKAERLVGEKVERISLKDLEVDCPRIEIDHHIHQTFIPTEPLNNREEIEEEVASYIHQKARFGTLQEGKDGQNLFTTEETMEINDVIESMLQQLEARSEERYKQIEARLEKVFEEVRPLKSSITKTENHASSSTTRPEPVDLQWIVSEIKGLRKNITHLEGNNEKLEGYNSKLKVEVQRLKYESDQLSEIRTMNLEVRNRFIETTRRDKFKVPNNEIDYSIIASGNRAAHNGDALADAALWSEGWRSNREIPLYLRLYKYPPTFVQQGRLRDCKAIIAIISARGTIASDDTIKDADILRTLDPLINELVDGYLKLNENAVADAFFWPPSSQLPRPPLLAKVMEIEAKVISIQGLSERSYGRIDFVRLCN